MFKNCKKKFNENYTVHRKKVVNNVIKIFQNVEDFIEIQMRGGNERRHCISF